MQWNTFYPKCSRATMWSSLALQHAQQNTELCFSPCISITQNLRFIFSQKLRIIFKMLRIIFEIKFILKIIFNDTNCGVFLWLH